MPRPTDSAGRHHLLQKWAASQGGVISRGEARRLGVTDDEVAAHIAAGRWWTMHPGIYYLTNGALTRSAVCWAALLWAGPDAALGYSSAAEVTGLIDPQQVGDVVTVLVPWERKVRPRPGIVIRRRRSLDRQVRRGAPASTRIEHTVLDLASESTSVVDAVGWITRAYQRRLTTPDRLSRALQSRVRIRQRRLLLALTASIDVTTESPLEHEYDRVARAHGLPAARAQASDQLVNRSGQARRIRRDRYYRTFRTAVELDGRLGHDDVRGRFRDLERDNASQALGRSTLRYGFADLFERPCEVAAQVGAVLRHNGWTGQTRACGPGCTALGSSLGAMGQVNYPKGVPGR